MRDNLSGHDEGGGHSSKLRINTTQEHFQFYLGTSHTIHRLLKVLNILAH